MTLNIDAKFNALGRRNYTGSQEDRELLFYKDNGATSNSLPDAELQFLTQRGFTSGVLSDRWKAYLNTFGYSGSVDDMLPQWWREALGSSLYLDFTKATPFTSTSGLDPRITFSRTTDATLTNSAGLVANAPMNLLTFSEQFDNAAWNKGTGFTLNANTVVAPDGTTTADAYTWATSTSVYAYLSQSVSSNSLLTHTFSIWLKTAAGTGSKTINLAITDVNVSTATSPSITVTESWQRFSFSRASASSTGLVGVGLVNGTAGTVFHVWGAQLELGSTATTYNPTTVKNLLGFTENFDNAAWTKSNAFVQTNLVTYSQDFDNAVWPKQNITLTPNSGIAPDGTQSADLFVASTNAAAYYYRGVTLANGAYTHSIYVKQSGVDSSSNFYFNDPAGSATVSLSFISGILSLSAVGITGSVYSAASATSTSVGNGWYRVTLTVTYTGGTIPAIALQQLSGRDGTSGLFIWGAQLVQGTSAGNYQATYAAAAAVGYTDIYGQPFAQKLVENTATVQHFCRQDVATTAGPYVLSFYAKAAERSVAWATLDGGSNTRWFNLSTGTTGGALGSSSITDIGGGWYRCSYTFTRAAGTAPCFIGVSNANNAAGYTGDGTSGIYIFGAQLSDSASVDPYVYNPVAAPSSVAYYGPRFDYDPVTLAPKGLLIEEQRTNLLTYSEQFDNAVWTKASVTATANTTVSPDGTANAETLTENTTGGEHVAFQQVSKAAAAITYTHSIYYKAGSGARNIGVALTDGTLGGLAAIFSTSGSVVLASQVVGIATGWTAVGAAVTAVGNGWFRASFTATTNTATRVDGVVYLVDGTTRSYTGNGTSSLLIWGAQLEAGAFATSYIPTVASQVTRTADSASMIGNNFARWYNVNEGTVYTQADVSVPVAVNAAVFSLGSTTSDIMRIFRQTDAQPVAQVITGGVAQATMGLGASWTTAAAQKIAFAYATNNFSATTNGGTTITDTSGTVPIVSQAVLGNAAGIGALNGHLSRVAFYSRVLSSAEQKGITA